MKIVIFLVGAILGIVVGRIWQHYISKSKTGHSGTIRIDNSDSDGPYMFLELNEDLDTVCNKKEIVCKINNTSYLSQK